MSLDISKLGNVRTRGGKTTARCPACAENGHDEKGEHLFINVDGRFGCVVYPGDSAEARAHRKRIFTLCGGREIKPLAVRPVSLGRLGRVNEDYSAGPSLKTGLLGRLGRVFQTHLEGDQQSTGDKKHPPEHQPNDCGGKRPKRPKRTTERTMRKITLFCHQREKWSDWSQGKRTRRDLPVKFSTRNEV
jgi:hypothetical protein